MIPISEELRLALVEYRKTVPYAGPYVISTERALATSPQAIVNLPALVPASRVRWLLQPQRQAHLYNQCSPEDCDRRGIAARCAGVSRAQ
jgi:hypothetical protein